MTTGSEVYAALSASSVEYWPAVTTNCELRNTLRNICLSTGILPGIVTSAPCSITPYGIPIFGPKIPTGTAGSNRTKSMFRSMMIDRICLASFGTGSSTRCFVRIIL